MNPAWIRTRDPALILAGILTIAAPLRAESDKPRAMSGATASVSLPAQPLSDGSFFGKLPGLATLYKNEGNSFIRELRIIGRYQGQYHWLDSAQGRNDGWENRRVRLGVVARFSHDIDFLAEVQSSDKFDPVYNGFTDIYLRWKPAEAFNLIIGRQKTQFGWDWLTTDTTILPFERSQIFNQTKIDRAPGVVVTGRLDGWTYEAGVYSNQVDQELGSFEGGVSFSLGIGCDFKGAFVLDRAEWRLDYLHSEIGAEDTVNNYWSDAFTTGFILGQGRAGLVAETIFGSGKDPGAIGFYLMPTFFLLPGKLQIVTRYTYSKGDGPNSIVPQKRYEQQAPNLIDGGKGSSYQAGYLGLQYFIHGERLKLMAGGEYARLDASGGGYNGWTWFCGVRSYF
jgi:phosphate-selective porin OprO and OprP